MTLLNKRYCSHCGTPNAISNHTCSKCGKPIGSALKTYSEQEEEVVIVKKRPVKAKRIIYEGDEDEFVGDISVPSSNDIIIDRPQKLTVGGLRNGAQIPSLGAFETFPNDIEVGSKSYFHQEKLD